MNLCRGGDGNYNEPYRLYNADVFEYELDSPMTLYGSIPFMQAHRKGSTVGVFWLNAAETWIDVTKAKSGTNPLSLGVKSAVDTQTHWISESGILDVFVLLGPTPKDISQTYGELTGFTALPQQFAIAYHQCRWNYVTDQDVMDVDRRFDKHKIPYDVIWLDIEYTDGKKYFTWDPLTFNDPKKMHKHLNKRERKLVAIIDPHIKNTDKYPVVEVHGLDPREPQLPRGLRDLLAQGPCALRPEDSSLVHRCSDRPFSPLGVQPLRSERTSVRVIGRTYTAAPRCD